MRIIVECTTCHKVHKKTFWTKKPAELIGILHGAKEIGHQTSVVAIPDIESDEVKEEDLRFFPPGFVIGILADLSDMN